MTGEDVTANVATIADVPKRSSPGRRPDPDRARGARRGLPAALGVRGAQPPPGRGGPADSSPIRATRRPVRSARRTRDHRLAAAVVLGVPARRGRRRRQGRVRLVSDVAHRRAGPAQEGRAAGEPGDPHGVEGIDAVYAFAQRAGRRHRHDLDYEIDGAVVKVDDLALQRAPRRDLARASLGDRLQVPARGAHDAARDDPRFDRPDRPGDPVRQARSPSSSPDRRSSSRRLHNEDQVREGRAARRHGDRAQGR